MSIKRYLPAILLLFLSLNIQAQSGYEHRGYLGWLIDMSSTACFEKWPSVKLDSAVIADYEETLDFLQRSDINEITPWGLFTNEYWQPQVEKTIDAKRKAIVKELIAKAHKRNIKVICGMGIYSWGFNKIIEENPSVKCACNLVVMDWTAEESWLWQKKVIDYVMDNFDFDGISMQSADRGRCNCGKSAQFADLEYHALINQKAVNYIRSRKPKYIIGISGWGMNFSNPADLKYIQQMTKNVDYLVDVGETALNAGKEYRQKLIQSILPCQYGSTAIPNVEPLQSMPRNYYLVPTVYHTCNALKEIYEEGGRACETYARTRGNPGDEVTVEVIAKILNNPQVDISKALDESIESVFQPENKLVTNELAKVFKEAENAFFENIPDESKFDRKIILLMPRELQTPSSEYIKAMEPAKKLAYGETIKKLYNRLLPLKIKVKNQAKFKILLQCFEQVIKDAGTERSFFKAKFEPEDKVLIAAGQVDTQDFLSFSKAMNNEIKPTIFMDYFDAHDNRLNTFFTSLNKKLSKISWETSVQLGLGFVNSDNKPYDSLVAAGYYNQNLHTMAGCLKQLNKPVFLRIGYEFHGSWNGYRPEFYINAFKQVVQILKEEQVENVATVWCAEAGALPDDYMKFYPGDECVDWWGIDLFSASDIVKSSSKDFAYNAALHKKPVMIGESTPRFTTTLKGEQSWDEWFVPYFNYIEAIPNVKAFCYINWDWVKYGKMWSADWISWGECRIEKNPVLCKKLKEKLKSELYYKSK